MKHTLFLRMLKKDNDTTGNTIDSNSPNKQILNGLIDNRLIASKRISRIKHRLDHHIHTVVVHGHMIIPYMMSKLRMIWMMHVSMLESWLTSF